MVQGFRTDLSGSKRYPNSDANPNGLRNDDCVVGRVGQFRPACCSGLELGLWLGLGVDTSGLYYIDHVGFNIVGLHVAQLV